MRSNIFPLPFCRTVALSSRDITSFVISFILIASVMISNNYLAAKPAFAQTACSNLSISKVKASGAQSGNPASSATDNKLDTRWSKKGTGSWIRIDLGSQKTVCRVDIAWYNGIERVNSFSISVSKDTKSYTKIFTGKSSGTTTGLERYDVPDKKARYVKITFTGNNVNNWASITEIDVYGLSSSGSPSPSPTPTPTPTPVPSGSTDKFGIKKIYSTKSGGEEWYMNMNNPTGDKRFNPQNTITMNSDGSWKMKSSKVRMGVYTSSGYSGDKIPTLDHSKIASKGYMLAPNDWKNVEMTMYAKVNTAGSDDNFAPYTRGGRHTGGGAPEGCEGSGYKGDLFFSGKVRFAKEQWHVSYVFTDSKSGTSSIKGKWVGFKFIMYNFIESGKTAVKMELWLDKNNDGKWVKVDENTDRGGWGNEGRECNGAPDQIITWGGPIATFRWDTATNVDFKNLSVREIQPPK
jgi:hypothetical protein